MEVIGRPAHVVRTQVPQVLDLVGLAKKAGRFPTELSGGEQQRVSIARAFVNRPLILLADEPTGNLDPATTVGIMRILDRINRTGTTVVMATHDQRIVDAMRRRVIELDHGHARPRPGARRLRRRELTPHHVDAHRVLRARDAGLAAPQRAHDARRHRDRGGVARRCSAASCMLSKWVDHGTERIKGGVTLEIFMNVEGHRAADRRRRRPARRTTPNVKSSYRHLDQGRRATRSSSGSSAGTPDLVESITAQDAPRVVPGRAQRRPSSPSTVQRRVQDRSQGVDEVEHAR